MDSRRRSYLIASSITVIAMIVAMLVVGVPGCKDTDKTDDGPLNPTTTSAVPQDPDAGEGEIYKEEYGDTGPQRAGTIRMANVPGTGATVLYDLPTARQIVYRTRTKGVGGSVSATPVALAPSLSQTMQMLSARNPAITTQKITRAAISIDGAKGTKVIQSLGKPTNTYSITAVARSKDQVATINAAGPLRKKATVEDLFDSLLQAFTLRGLSASDREAIKGADKPGDNSSDKSGGKSGDSDKAGGSDSSSSKGTRTTTEPEGDIPIPTAPAPPSSKKKPGTTTQSAPARIPVS